MKTLSTQAVCFDREGYQERSGLTVIDTGEVIVIGATEHLKSDLEITGNRITSRHGWFVLLNISTAAAMGAVGGKQKTKAKSAAARANGAKGGRPRKSKLTEEAK